MSRSPKEPLENKQDRDEREHPVKVWAAGKAGEEREGMISVLMTLVKIAGVLVIVVVACLIYGWLNDGGTSN